MADSFSKKEREKKKRQKKKEKELRKQERREAGTRPEEIMYVDYNGNFTPNPPEELPEDAEISLEDIQISTPKKEESDENEFERNGVVKFFNDEKGYGFIIDPKTQESFFVHADNLNEEITQNDKVSFEVGKGDRGPVALNVSII